MKHDLLVICSKFLQPTNAIEDAVTSLFSKYKNYVILILVDPKLDVEGQFVELGSTIEITINSKAQNPLLTLANELVHTEQYLTGKSQNEDEALAKEQEYLEYLKKSLAI